MTDTLRPVTAADLDAFALRFADATGTGAFQWFGFPDARRERRRFERRGLLTPDGGVLAVWDATDTLAGRTQWYRSYWGPADNSWCWSIAIGLFPEARGAGLGTRAQCELVDYLFANTRAQRVQAWTDVDNLAEQHALDHAGFRREGVVRSAQWRCGSWHDQVLFARIRTDRAGGPLGA